MSQHHKFIYGFVPEEYQNYKNLEEYQDYEDTDATLEDYQDYEKIRLACEPKPPFKKYYVDMYGQHEDTIIGFEFGGIVGIFDNPPSVFDGELIFSKAKPPQEIIDLFKITYPNEEPECHAIIQGVYTYHYATGVIAYGYWIEPLDDLDDLDDNSNNEPDIEPVEDPLFEASCCIHSKNYEGLELYNVAHTSETEQFFIGQKISDMGYSELGGGTMELYENLTKSYKPCVIPKKEDVLKFLKDEFDIPGDKIKLSYFPVLTFIPTMCYCCT